MVSLNASFNEVSAGVGGRDEVGESSGFGSVLLEVVDDDSQRTSGAGSF